MNLGSVHFFKVHLYFLYYRNLKNTQYVRIAQVFLREKTDSLRMAEPRASADTPARPRHPATRTEDLPNPGPRTPQALPRPRGPPLPGRSPGPLEEAEGGHVVRGFEKHYLGLAFVEDAEAIQLHGATAGLPRKKRREHRPSGPPPAADGSDRLLPPGSVSTSGSGRGPQPET